MATKGDTSQSKRTIGSMFPKERLQRLQASKTVTSMTPGDLQDMEKAFAFNPERVDNKKIQALTTHDLVTLESLFSDYRMEVISNFQGVASLAAVNKLKKGDSCCCCCTPCCCCCAATETDPVRA